MKKILTAALSVLLIVSLIGCGGKEKADDKTASNSDKPSYWSELEVSADALCNKYLSPDTKNKVSKIIYDINPIIDPSQSDFYYEYSRTESDSLTAIGLEGLPVILSVSEREKASKDLPFLQTLIFSRSLSRHLCMKILRIRRRQCRL